MQHFLNIICVSNLVNTFFFFFLNVTTVVWLANCYGNMDTNTVTQTTTSAFENMVSGSYCIIANRVKCGIDSSVQ